jgi:predicted DNA-binding transcriptional regulator YafY
VPAYLDAVQQAVIDGEQIELAYVARDGQASVRTVHPLGVAAKGAVWYLVGDTEAGMRTFRVDRVRSVASTGEPVVRPEGFDLAEAWKLITENVDQLRTPVRARAVVSGDYVGLCRMLFGSRLRIGPARDDGRVDVELRGHSVPALAGEIAGLGAGVEVLEPQELRDQLARLGRELTSVYG